MSHTLDDATSLEARLLMLKAEHRDLDDAIASLEITPTKDDLLLRRLKKRKLALKDRITQVKGMLVPDEPA